MAFDPGTATLDSSAFDPATARPEPPAKPRGYAAAFASGVPEALYGTFAKGLSLAAAAPAIGIDKLRGMVSGREETGAQDFVFRNLTDAATEKAQQYALTPEEAANPAKAILHGLGGLLPTLAAAVATRGAIGGKELAAQTAAVLPRAAAPWMLNAAEGAVMMAPAAVVTGAASGAQKVEQGTDLPTAYKTGAIDTAGAIAQGALPLSVTGGLVKRVASGAGINVVAGEAQRQAQNAVLGERPDLRRGMSAQDMALDAATGALFAGILGPRPAKQAVQAAKADLQTELDKTDPNTPPPAAAEVPRPPPAGAVAAPVPAAPLLLGYTPRPGDFPAVFSDGTVALNAQQIAAKRAGTDNLTDRYAAEARGQIARTQAAIEALRAERAAAEAVTNPPGAVSLPPVEPPAPPTAMELAMRRAQQQAGFARAETDTAVAKQADLDKIQTLTQAEQLAVAAARGETPANTVPLARPHADFVAAADELLSEANSPRFKQDVAQAVRGKKTLGDQVAALRALQEATKNQQSNRYEYLGRLIEKFTEAKAPDEAPSPQAPETVAPAAQGKEISPATAGTSAEAAALPARGAEAVDLSKINPAQLQPSGKDRRGAGDAELPDPIQGAIDALKAAYGNDTDAMQAARRIIDQANAAAPNGRADPEVMVRMALDDAQHRASQSAEETEAAPAGPRNAALDPAREAAMEEVRGARVSLQALADEYATRLAAREELPEAEHERYARAAEVVQALQDATREGARPMSSEFLKDLAGFAKDYASPEAWAKAKGEGLAKLASDPGMPSPGLSAMMGADRPLNDFLDHLVTRGSSPDVQALATKLRAYNLQTTVGKEAPRVGQEVLSANPKSVLTASYDPATDRMQFASTLIAEMDLLHEATHAATIGAIKHAASIDTPRNQVEAQMQQSLLGLEKLRLEVSQRAANADERYGVSNAYEFMAEANSNPVFQDFLRRKGLWQRVVEAVRRMLGLSVESRTALDRAMDLQQGLFSKAAYDAAIAAKTEARAFENSYQGAAQATDAALAKMVQAADEDSRWRNFGRATARGVVQRLLNWETKQYIVNRVTAIPEFRATGLADAVRAMYQTDQSRRDANTYTQRAAADFAGKLHKALHGITDGAERQRANDMAGKVSTGASIGGFDPTKNFKDNLVERPDLDPRREKHVNQTYRDFVALQRAYPKLAEAIVDGARANRHDFVSSTSVLVDSLLKHAISSQQKLEAELNRMDPAQAAIQRLRMGSATPAAAETALANFYAGKLDFMAKDVQGAPNADPKRFYDGASAELHKRLTEVFQQTAALPKGALRDQLLDLGRVYEQQIGNAYYHAGRAGDYFVNVGFKDMDDATWAKMDAVLEGTGRALGDYTDQDHVFMKVDSLEQAQALRRKLTAAGGEKIDETRNRHGKWAEEYRLDNNAGISAALRSVLDTVQESVSEVGLDVAQAAAMREVISRKFLSMLPETSVKTAKLHRAGVPGYDTDFLGTFAKHAAASTRDTANLYTMRAYSHAINGMTEGVARLSEMPDGEFQARGQMVRDEMLRRYNDSMKPVDNKHVDLINSLGHSFYLALSPAFLIRSMAQPYHRGLPYLGSRYGFVSSAKEIGAATGVAMKILGKAILDGWRDDGVTGMVDAGLKFDDLGLSAKEVEFMREMQDRGVFDLGQARQLQRMAVGGSPRTQNAVRVASMTAQWSDMVNRIATGLAAFRLAEKGKSGLLGDQSTMAHMNYADAAVKYIMDDFSPDNTARAIGKQGVFGKVTPLATAFMNYNLQTMQQIARTVLDGMFGHDKTPEGLQRASEARRELAGIMGTTSMIAGALGLPFANVFAGVYNTIADLYDEDEPRDIRIAARNWLADNFGAPVGEAIAHGPLQALTGVESYTFGMQNLLPGSEFLSSRRLLKDRLDELPKTLMGPALNAGLDLAAGMAKISDGQLVKGIGQMLPSGLKGYWKAGEIAAHGFTDSKGNPIGLPATPWDIAVQTTGLRPAVRAETAEAAAEISAHQQRINARKASINDRIFKAYRFDGDMTGPLGEMAAFNAKNPLQPIRDVAGSIRARMMQEALGAQIGGVGVPSKRLLPVYGDLTRFNRGGMP